MKDWKALAAALGATITDPERVIPVLESLEAGFRPLTKNIPHDVEPPLTFRPYREPEADQ
jgi:hypothetical protein